MADEGGREQNWFVDLQEHFFHIMEELAESHRAEYEWRTGLSHERFAELVMEGDVRAGGFNTYLMQDQDMSSLMFNLSKDYETIDDLARRVRSGELSGTELMLTAGMSGLPLPSNVFTRGQFTDQDVKDAKMMQAGLRIQTWSAQAGMTFDETLGEQLKDRSLVTAELFRNYLDMIEGAGVPVNRGKPAPGTENRAPMDSEWIRRATAGEASEDTERQAARQMLADMLFRQASTRINMGQMARLWSEGLVPPEDAARVGAYLRERREMPQPLLSGEIDMMLDAVGGQMLSTMPPSEVRPRLQEAADGLLEQMEDRGMTPKEVRLMAHEINDAFQDWEHREGAEMRRMFQRWVETDALNRRIESDPSEDVMRLASDVVDVLERQHDQRSADTEDSLSYMRSVQEDPDRAKSEEGLRRIDRNRELLRDEFHMLLMVWDAQLTQLLQQGLARDEALARLREHVAAQMDRMGLDDPERQGYARRELMRVSADYDELGQSGSSGDGSAGGSGEDVPTEPPSKIVREAQRAVDEGDAKREFEYADLDADPRVSQLRSKVNDLAHAVRAWGEAFENPSDEDTSSVDVEAVAREVRDGDAEAAINRLLRRYGALRRELAFYEIAAKRLRLVRPEGAMSGADLFGGEKEWDEYLDEIREESPSRLSDLDTLPPGGSGGADFGAPPPSSVSPPDADEGLSDFDLRNANRGMGTGLSLQKDAPETAKKYPKRKPPKSQRRNGRRGKGR